MEIVSRDLTICETLALRGRLRPGRGRGPSGGGGGSAMPLIGVSQFERFFRVAAGLDVDKDDLKRCQVFVNHKVADLLIRAEALAKADGRDLVEYADLPITKGLQESIDRFEELDAEVELAPVLERITAWPQLDVGLTEGTRASLPRVAGGLCLALARSFRLMDPEVKNPQTKHWEQAFQVFDLLL
jgi:hypothetical protein